MPLQNKSDYFNEFISTIEGTIPYYVLDKGISFQNPHPNAEFVYNTEQLSRPDWLQKMIDVSKTKRLIDYSGQNIHLLQGKSLYLPILFSKKYLYNTSLEKSMDVSFLGALSQRRSKVLQELYNKGVSINVINEFDLYVKNKEVLKSKVLLNMHADETYQVFEFARCSIPVFNGQIVVSETTDVSKETGTNLEVVKHVIFSPYDKLADTVIDVLKNIDKYKFTNDYEKLEAVSKSDRDNFLKEL